MAQWLALHSRPVFRDGFLLAYNMWCWNSCWVGSALSFPVGFSSNSKKEAPIGVPGTSIRSVPTLTGEGINTHSWACGESSLSYWGLSVFSTIQVSFDWRGGTSKTQFCSQGGRGVWGGLESAHVIFEQPPQTKIDTKEDRNCQIESPFVDSLIQKGYDITWPYH